MQITAYVVLGLAAVGGPGTSDAMLAATAFGWATSSPRAAGPRMSPTVAAALEYSVIDAEVARAIATLFNTPAGSNVSVAPAQLSTVRFSTVSTSGLTSVVAVDHAAAVIPNAYEVIRGLDYNVLTTASVSGDTVACFVVSWIADPATFADVRILHEEQGVLVDRTILAAGPLAPQFASRQVCARVSSLTTFALALRDSRPPDLTVTLTPSVLSPADHRMVTVTAAIKVTDDHDPAPRVTLVSISVSDGDHEQGDGESKGDIMDAQIGTDDRTFRLKADRTGRGGRTYTIVYRATDRPATRATSRRRSSSRTTARVLEFPPPHHRRFARLSARAARPRRLPGGRTKTSERVIWQNSAYGGRKEIATVPQEYAGISYAVCVQRRGIRVAYRERISRP